eukprot:GEMP01049033.1.p1 GENE.GEMP01049033.1~~GEMP01049033.1.p1  ORF type:complete len:383 (+),score=65.96 GEMP01049033.1:47-1150(+)
MVNPLDVDETLLKDYDAVRRVGRGCYGIVWQVTRKRDNKVFAVKRIYDAFQNPQDSQRTYREVLILLNLRGFSGIVTLHEVIQTTNDKEIYLVLDNMQTDLQSALTNTTMQAMHKQHMIYQIFRSLKFIHSASVIYRDLKPSNILLNANGEIKLCDFGSARLLDEDVDVDTTLTDYVSSRWYRAPELLMVCRRYRFSIDMWAAGCILGELLGSKPMFISTSTLHLMDNIIAICGKPTEQDIDSMRSPYAATMLQPYLAVEPANLEKMFPRASKEACDLLRLLLQFNPNKRLTAQEAMRHPYVGSFHNPDDEPIFGRALTLKLPCAELFLSSTYRDQIYSDVIEIPRARRRLGVSTPEETNKTLKNEI